MCKFKTKITQIFDISNTAQTENYIYSEIRFLSLTQLTFHCPFIWKGVVFDTMYYMYYPLTKPRGNFYLFNFFVVENFIT